MVEVGLLLLERVLALVPQFLLRRFLPPERVAGQVVVDLRRVNPVNLLLQSSEVPQVALWFRIGNRSLVDLVLDRLLVELWVGQPTFRGALLERLSVPRRSDREDIYFWQDLTAEQQRQVRSHTGENGLLSVPVTVYVKAYFESKIGMVFVSKMLEHRDVPVQ